MTSEASDKKSARAARRYRASEKGRAWNEAFRKRRLEEINKLKDAPCADCGGRFHPCAMDFDHRPGEIKLFCVGRGIRYSAEVLYAEIAKCDLVCSNCHRVRTFVTREKKS